MISGVALAGLAMSSTELPSLPGILGLENPEVRGAASLGETYTLEDVAHFHLKSIEDLQIDRSKPFLVIGMSMGGMIASILASELRNQLPQNTKFIFLVTSPNLPSNPALPIATLRDWFSVQPGNEADFRRILTPMFSKSFRESNKGRVEDYIVYRTQQRNGQGSPALVRQIKALQKFDGRKYFSSVDPNESTFIGGNADEILGPSHNQDLRELNPNGKHTEVKGLGHMINIERPDLFQEFVR